MVMNVRVTSAAPIALRLAADGCRCEAVCRLIVHRPGGVVRASIGTAAIAAAANVRVG